MYQDLKTRLQNSSYTLSDARARIAWGVANGHLTTDQADELQVIAGDHALTSAPEVTIPELDARQDELEGALLELAELISTLASGGTVEPLAGGAA